MVRPPAVRKTLSDFQYQEVEDWYSKNHRTSSNSNTNGSGSSQNSSNAKLDDAGVLSAGTSSSTLLSLYDDDEERQRRRQRTINTVTATATKSTTSTITSTATRTTTAIADAQNDVATCNAAAPLTKQFATRTIDDMKAIIRSEAMINEMSKTISERIISLKRPANTLATTATATTTIKPSTKPSATTTITSTTVGYELSSPVIGNLNTIDWHTKTATKSRTNPLTTTATTVTVNAAELALTSPMSHSMNDYLRESWKRSSATVTSPLGFGKSHKRMRHTSSSSSSSSAESPNHILYTSHKSVASKRKRRASVQDKDTELGLEQPSAKRQQTTTVSSATNATDTITSYLTLDGGDSSSSLMSSVYPSPDDGAVHELLSARSSPTAGIDVLHHGVDLPESPASPLPDSPDSPPSPDRGTLVVQQHIVRYVDDSKLTANDENELLVAEHEEHGLDASYTDDASSIGEHNDDDDDEIISATTSPSVSSTSSHAQRGERTPGVQQSHNNNNNNNNNKTCKHNNNVMPKCFESGTVSSYPDLSCMSPAMEPLRLCPLPALSWANASDVWQRMCEKDEKTACLRSSHMLEQHPGLQPRMRAILLDWLIEVCEVYKLHRETYYLAVDYLDRYLNVAKKVQKTHLQLIGITCLFMAAKVEEIYPPKIGEFAYVTDGACTEHEILQHEKLLLQALNWQISPFTAMGWLGVYMQLNVNNHTPASLTNIAQQQQNDAFIYPQFSGLEFVQTAQLLDLSSLDIGMSDYPYSVIAAAAISHTFNRETALRCSGLDWEVVEPCARWMEPFFHVVSDVSIYLNVPEQNEQVESKFGLEHVCPNIVTDDSHIIQSHTVTMDMYDRVLFLQHQMHAAKIKQEASPATGLICPDGLLTPPASSRKPLEEIGVL